VRKNKQLAARFTVIAGAMAFVTASAFADSRPSDETRWRDGNRGSVRRDGDRDRDEYRRRDESRNNRNDDRYEHGRGERYQTRGQVSRVDRYGSGYRVYVGGARYPFHVPDRHYRRDRFRVGVTINIGGVYNPGGYYDYYEHDDRGYSRADLRGVVQDIDRRRGTFLLRNDSTGRHVTVSMRDNERVRRGDYVELYGDWSRGGVFRAYDVDVVDRRPRRW
jgi:hypothetical protein